MGDSTESDAINRSRHHVKDPAVDSSVAGAVVHHIDVSRGHVDARDVDGHRVVGLLEGVRVLIHAEAARVALLEHVLELSAGHLGETRVDSRLQAPASLPAHVLADVLDLRRPVRAVERLDAAGDIDIEEVVVGLDLGGGLGLAELRESLAERLTPRWVPVAVVVAAVRVPIAVSFDSVPVVVVGGFVPQLASRHVKELFELAWGA